MQNYNVILLKEEHFHNKQYKIISRYTVDSTKWLQVSLAYYLKS